MFGRLFLAEEAKIWKRTLFWVEVALLVTLALIQLVSNYTTAVGPTVARASDSLVQINREALRARASAGVTWPTVFAALLGNVGQIAWLAVIVLTGALIAQEYNWRTLHVWLGRGVPRLTLLAAKSASLAAPLLLLILLPLLAGGLLSIVFTNTIKGGLDVAQVNFGRLALGIVTTAYALLPYVAVTTLLAVAGRSTVTALGGGMAFVVVDLALTLSGTPIAPYMPFGLINALQALNAGIGAGAAATADAAGGLPLRLLSPGPAAAAVALWTAVCLAAAAGIFWRQDLTD